MKPNNITIQTINIPTEGENTTVAVCIASGFRPESGVDISWLFRNSSTLPQSTTVFDSNTNTFRIAAYFIMNMFREDNGQSLTCSINHLSLDEPLIETSTLIVKCKYII